MSVEAAALGVGKALAKLVASRWMAARTAKHDAETDLVDLIKTGFPDQIMRRKTVRQFEAIADSVAERLMPLTRQELRDLDDGTREAALFQVQLTLDRADLSDKALLADDMDPVKLARRLRTTMPARQAGFQLGEAGARLYDIVLDECCDCLAHAFVHLPQFTERAAAESLARLTSAAAQLETILSRLPARTLAAPEGEDLDDEFTRRYLAFISDDLDRLELFGVRFERFTRPQTTLSVAYVSLNVTDEDKTPERDPREPFSIAEWREERRATGAVRVEHALADRPRILIRGEAGGGKSTLLRWLAIMAARSGFTGELAPLNGCVPFLIKLRSHAGRPLPRPEEFLDDTAPALSGLMPKGWVHRRLMSARSLLLVDGIDEITEPDRPNARRWLSQLTTQFPGVRVVVTSRPAAADADWLRAEGFRTAFLEPLGPADVRALIQHWHLAVRESDGLPCPPEKLPSYEAKLLARLESAGHLQTLASTPLLAAMLSALNLDRETLPRSRMRLYADVIDMLIETRDAKRSVSSVQAIGLESDQKIRILQDLAFRLSESDRVELATQTVRQMIVSQLKAMPQVRANADEVLRILLQRSGIIREPIPGRIDFVHRTIQEYLAAAQVAELDDVDLLVLNAHDDRWRETIIMAAGHGNDSFRRNLITSILRRAQTEPPHAEPLGLLAASCLETLPSVPDDLREALDRCLDALIPPGDEDAARTLAAVGEPVLKRLPASIEGLPIDAARATVRVAWLINGPESLGILRRYAADHRFGVQTELSTAWYYFDADEYAEHVLSAVPPGGRLLVTTPDQLAALGKVAPISELSVYLRHPFDLRSLAAQANSLEHLTLGSAVPGLSVMAVPELPKLRTFACTIPGFMDLGVLNALPPLERIEIVHCEEIGDYSPLMRSDALTTLVLGHSRGLHSLSQLPPLRNLTDLVLDGSGLSRGALEELADSAPYIWTLNLDNSDWLDDLGPLASFGLHHLSFAGSPAVSDLRAVRGQTTLTRLDASHTRVATLAPLVYLNQLQVLKLNGCASIANLSPLAALRNLQHLEIASIAPGTDLSPLSRNRNLIVHIAPDQDVRGAEKLGSRIRTSASGQ